MKKFWELLATLLCLCLLRLSLMHLEQLLRALSNQPG